MIDPLVVEHLIDSALAEDIGFISVGRITQSAPAVDIGLDAVIRT